MQVCSDDTRVGVSLRRRDGKPVLFAMTDVLGMETDVARAEFFGVSTKTMSRICDGPIGGKFMAHAVAALSRHRDVLARHQLHPSLDALFEVGEKPAPQMAKAA